MFPKEFFIYQVSFDADPAKKEKMIAIVYNEINEMIKNGPDPAALDKVKEHLLKRKREESSEKNSKYWADKTYVKYVFGLDQLSITEEVISSITPKMVQDFARYIFNQQNIIEVVMDPKK